MGVSVLMHLGLHGRNAMLISMSLTYVLGYLAIDG